MTEETNAQGTPQESPPDGAQNTANNPIPYERFKQKVDEVNDLKARLEQLEAAQRTQQETELTEQQRFKELAEQRAKELEQLKPVQDQAQSYRQALDAMNQSRLEQIPEDRRSLVPSLDDPVKLSEYLNTNWHLLATAPKPTPPKLDGAAGSVGDPSPVKLTDAEKSFADALGMSYERYAAQKEKRNQPLNTDRFGGKS